jgi:hypothetical protein
MAERTSISALPLARLSAKGATAGKCLLLHWAIVEHKLSENRVAPAMSTPDEL